MGKPSAACGSLRALLARERCLQVPGVYDCLSALLAHKAGFRAVAISGYAVEASLLGRPDLGFTGLTDVEGVARRVAAAVPVPVVCDADTGYGDAKHVHETVRRIEAAGAAAVHIEDQVDPKRCGGMTGRDVIGAEDMAAKIAAAVDARAHDDFVVIGRTDCLESEGLDAAVKRLNCYARAGADVVFAAEAYTPEQLRELTCRVDAPVAICAGIPGWPAAFESRETYESWGVRVVLYPFVGLYPAARAMQETYTALADRDGLSERDSRDRMIGFDAFNDLVDLTAWRDREQA